MAGTILRTARSETFSPAEPSVRHNSTCRIYAITPSKRKHDGVEDINDINKHKKSKHKSSIINEMGAIKVPTNMRGGNGKVACKTRNIKYYKGERCRCGREKTFSWRLNSCVELGLKAQLNSGLIEYATLPCLGIRVEELNLNGKAELMFVDQVIATAAVLTVLFGVTTSLGPLPDDVYRYDWRKPFDLQKGWLLWAGVGFVGALISVAITGAAVSFFSGEMPERETDALVRLLPLIGSSSISTACLVGITGVLAPILEETVFRGFLMVYLTKWVPTPTAIIISATAFALAHLTPGEIPQLFVLGSALGLSYAQTRNLLTPITIHALWNSGVILVLTFLQLQGYDIKEIIGS